ncbi:MAG: hypothetical protein ABI769_18645 [Pseudomonadota bacterium]
MNRIRVESSPRPRHNVYRKLLAALVCVAAAASIAPAGATDLGSDRFTLRGFGTAAATFQDADNLEFRRNVGQGKGLPADELNLYTDSVAGVQVNGKVSERMDVVLQGLTRMNVEGDWNPRLTQAFVRYSSDESFVVRAGRIGFDIYLLAESRQVGYSYVPLRPSTEFYGLLPNDAIDGGDVTVTHRLGRVLFRGRIFAGTGLDEMAFADGTHENMQSEVLGACFDLLYGGWTARVALGRWRYDTGSWVSELIDGLRVTGVPQALAVANDLDQPTFQSRGIELGLAYDEGPLKAQLMWGDIGSDPFFGPDTHTLYAFAGYRLRQWTPFASFSRSRDRAPLRTTGLPDIPELAPLNGAVETMQASVRTTQHTMSVGVRYDLSAHVDLKFQLDRAKLSDTALVFDRRADPRADANMTIAAVAVDFVF